MPTARAASPTTDEIGSAVLFKQPCPPLNATPPTVAHYTTPAFTEPGKYLFICNFTSHMLDENVTITGPTGSTTASGFGMHGIIEVQ